MSGVVGGLLVLAAVRVFRLVDKSRFSAYVTTLERGLGREPTSQWKLKLANFKASIVLSKDNMIPPFLSSSQFPRYLSGKLFFPLFFLHISAFLASMIGSTGHAPATKH